MNIDKFIELTIDNQHQFRLYQFAYFTKRLHRNHIDTIFIDEPNNIYSHIL